MGDLHSLGYSREAESNADVTGSDICAAAGYNPWGLVWLFQAFQNADTRQLPQLLSDHPANGSRIQTLEKHFRDNPSVFAKFNSDPKSATPFQRAEGCPRAVPALPTGPSLQPDAWEETRMTVVLITGHFFVVGSHITV